MLMLCCKLSSDQALYRSYKHAFSEIRINFSQSVNDCRMVELKYKRYLTIAESLLCWVTLTATCSLEQQDKRESAEFHVGCYIARGKYT